MTNKDAFDLRWEWDERHIKNRFTGLTPYTRSWYCFRTSLEIFAKAPTASRAAASTSGNFVPNWSRPLNSPRRPARREPGRLLFLQAVWLSFAGREVNNTVCDFEQALCDMATSEDTHLANGFCQPPRPVDARGG
jgi:hypothetical protein